MAGKTSGIVPSDCSMALRAMLFRRACYAYVSNAIAPVLYIEDCKLVEINFEDHKARKLKFSIVSNEGILDSVELKEADGLLADFSTPVHLLSSHNNDRSVNKLKNSFYSIRKSNIYQYAPDLNYFTFYHNSSRKAALLYSYHGPMNISLDGNIGNYVLRRLPKIINNKYQYIYVKILDTYQALLHKDSYISDISPREKINLEATHINALNIKLLVILDLEKNYIKSSAELIKTVLMFYNNNNMLFSDFESPSIDFMLKGIVFPQDTDITSNSTVLTLESINNVKEFVEKLTPYFQLENHDIVTVLTQRMILLDNETRRFTEAMIINEHKICEGNAEPTLILSPYYNYQTVHDTFLAKILPMFGTNDFKNRLNTMCPEFVVNVQPDYVNGQQLWPSCIITEYSKYFRHNICSEFDTN
ncbi:uncharacterized protein LOC130678717 [Microplitis mediator]|uniref:uncharacterized protein LOC130678717 n=1 Tax=Microplitis mediator TaxID=375433 RepID=UPI0025525051|nr:uncharacterized protein LOC130678717 [Microplitis mediator]